MRGWRRGYLGFDVAVADLALVQDADALKDLPRDVAHGCRGACGVVRHEALEVAVLGELHREVHVLGVFEPPDERDELRALARSHQLGVTGGVKEEKDSRHARRRERPIRACSRYCTFSATLSTPASRRALPRCARSFRAGPTRTIPYPARCRGARPRPHAGRKWASRRQGA